MKKKNRNNILIHKGNFEPEKSKFKKGGGLKNFLHNIKMGYLQKPKKDNYLREE